MPLESRPDWLELRRSLDRLPAPRWLVFGENSRLSPRILLIWTLRLDWLLMLIVVLGMDCLLRKISCFLAADRFLPCLDLEDYEDRKARNDLVSKLKSEELLSRFRLNFQLPLIDKLEFEVPSGQQLNFLEVKLIEFTREYLDRVKGRSKCKP